MSILTDYEYLFFLSILASRGVGKKTLRTIGLHKLPINTAQIYGIDFLSKAIEIDGKKQLRKLKKLWKKNRETESFEEYLDKKKKVLPLLDKCKSEIMNTQEISDLLRVWAQVQKLINSS